MTGKKQMIKRAAAIIMIMLLMCLCIAGCGKKEKVQPSQNTATIKVEEAKNADTGRIDIEKETETEKPEETESETKAPEETEKETESEKAATRKIVTSESGVNIRRQPSTEAEILGGLNPGEKADFIDQANGWIHINYNGVEGYVSADYAQVTEVQE